MNEDEREGDIYLYIRIHLTFQIEEYQKKIK